MMFWARYSTHFLTQFSTRAAGFLSLYIFPRRALDGVKPSHLFPFCLRFDIFSQFSLEDSLGVPHTGHKCQQRGSE